MKKKYPKVLPKRMTCIIACLFFGFLFLYSGGVFSQITSTTSAMRCGEGTVVLTASASSGTIKWYDVPFYGAPVATGAIFTTPELAVTTTFYVDALDENGCSLNGGGTQGGDGKRIAVIATISANAIQAAIYYSSSTFCKSIESVQLISLTGTSGGLFEVTPSVGLSIAGNGDITPSTSTAGTYNITYMAPPTTGCVEEPATTTVAIVEAPLTPEISYVGSPWCTTEGSVSVSRTGASGGLYNATPSGLNINNTTGEITPNSSLNGTYTVSYSVPGTGGCDPQTATATVEILQLPTASVSYNGPFTQNEGSQSVSLSGTGVYTGGVYSYAGPGTLNLDTSTGVLNPSVSDAGTYIITYTLAAVSPCAEVSTTTSVSIYGLPTATISGDADVCQGAAIDPEISFMGSDGTAPYTFTYKVNDGFDISVVTTGENNIVVAQSVLTPGAYGYELVSVTDANGSTRTYSTENTATITVSIPDVALFSYNGLPYCSNGTDPTPTFLDGGIAGTFSSTSGLVFVDELSGEIDLSASTAGTYTVTNTIAATGGCSEVVATAHVTISRLQDATFAYDGSPYCSSGGDAVASVNDVGIFTSDNQFLTFLEGDGVAPGTIDLNLTPTGTYTITNTISAADGCVSIVENATIIIESAPEVSNAGLYQICSGENTDITLSSSPSGANFSWTIGTVSTGITGASGGTGTLINQLLNNSSNTVIGSVEYIVTPILGTGDCSVGSPFTIQVEVNPLPVTPTAGNLTATYDGVEHSASASSQSGSSVVWYDTETGGNIVTAPTGTDVGTYTSYAESVTDENGCRSTSRILVTLQIYKKALTLTATGPTKIYGTALTAGTSTTNFIAGATDVGSEAVTGITLTPDAAGLSATTEVSTAYLVTPSLATGSNGFLESNYNITYEAYNGTVAIRQLTVAVPSSLTLSKEYDGGTTAAVTVGELSGVVSGDVVTVSAVANYADASVGTGKTITVVYTLGGAALANYIKPVDYLVTTGIITAKALTITATGSTKIYGTALSIGVSVTNFTADASGVASEAVTSVTLTPDAAGLFATTAAGDAYIVTPSLATGTGGFFESNYDITYTDYDGTVVAKQLSSLSYSLTTEKEYDGNIIAGATVSGLVGVEVVDNGNVGVTVAATYDNADVGTNKTITVVFELTGTKKDNYIKPIDTTLFNGKITPAAPSGSDTQSFCSPGDEDI